MPLVKVQAKGQMTVPAPIREALHIDEGSALACIQTGPETFSCHVLPKAMGLRAFVDAHTVDCPELTQEDINAAVEAGMRAEAEARYGKPKISRFSWQPWAAGWRASPLALSTPTWRS